jgi:hypothetical protein
MTMGEHYTNLSALRLHYACESRYNHLVAALGPEWGDETPIPLVRILDINGLDDAIWALRANLHPEAEKLSRLYACDCAERVAHLNTDPSVQAAINTGRKYAHGEATDAELSDACAAWDAASCAAWDAASWAAEAAWAAWATCAAGAAWDAWVAGATWAAAARTARAAEAAGYDAAARAAWDAEREWQEAHFRKMFG